MGNSINKQYVNQEIVPEHVLMCFYKLASSWQKNPHLDRFEWYMDKDDYKKGCQELDIDIESEISVDYISEEMFSRAYLGSRAVQVFGNPDLRQMILAHNIPNSDFAARYGNLAFFLTFPYWTPTNQTLCTAAKYGQLSLVEYLHQERDIQDPTAIIDAIRNGHVDVVRYLVDKKMYNQMQLYHAFLKTERSKFCVSTPDMIVHYAEKMRRSPPKPKEYDSLYLDGRLYVGRVLTEHSFKHVPSKELVELISKSTLDPMKRSFYIRNAIKKHPMVIQALIEKSSLMVPIISDLPTDTDIGQTIQSIKMLDRIGIHIFNEDNTDVVCNFMSSVLSGDLFEWILVNKIQKQKTCNYGSFLDTIFETTVSPEVINILLKHGYKPKIAPRVLYDIVDSFDKCLRCIDIHGMLMNQLIEIDKKCLISLRISILHIYGQIPDEKIIRRIPLFEQFKTSEKYTDIVLPTEYLS